jgi:beta-fructofuranosidase
MMECPDLFPLDGRWVLTFSPMYHPEFYGNYYIVGDMDFGACRFTALSSGRLDYGTDYYAAQSYELNSGERAVIAWQNGWTWMPWFEGWGPTNAEGWRGTLSVPRRYYLNRSLELCSEPYSIWKSLRRKEQIAGGFAVSATKRAIARSICFVASFSVDFETFFAQKMELGLMDDGVECVIATIDRIRGAFVIDKVGHATKKQLACIVLDRDAEAAQTADYRRS